VQVHEDHVGPQQSRKFDGFSAIASLSNHLHVRLQGKQQRYTPAHEGLIFGDDDSNWGSARFFAPCHV
jgi:hypothetical protein